MSKKRDAYQVITDRIIALLEQGTIPWRKPWRGGNLAPRSLNTGKPYRGINAFLLSCAPYESPYWVTYKQAQARGGQVRKGEKGCPIVFWKWLERQDDETGETKRFPLLRYYTVFNVAQVDGLSIGAPEAETEPKPFEPIAECERIAAGMPNAPELQHIEAAAWYRPADDLVNLPARELFEQPAEYYSTLFHELGHATGHKNRLDRKTMGVSAFGAEDYSREELVAEMCAAFLCGKTGIDCATVENSAAYIDNWRKRLKGDAQLVVTAAAQAQKAADFILGEEREVTS